MVMCTSNSLMITSTVLVAPGTSGWVSYRVDVASVYRFVQRRRMTVTFSYGDVFRWPKSATNSHCRPSWSVPASVPRLGMPRRACERRAAHYRLAISPAEPAPWATQPITNLTALGYLGLTVGVTRRSSGNSRANETGDEGKDSRDPRDVEGEPGGYRQTAPVEEPEEFGGGDRVV
jgi:hypothetical protein